MQNNIDNKAKKPITILINGISGSGKSTLTERIQSYLEKNGKAVAIFEQDNSYRDLTTPISLNSNDDVIRTAENLATYRDAYIKGVSFDSRYSIDMVSMVRDIALLKQGVKSKRKYHKSTANLMNNNSYDDIGKLDVISGRLCCSCLY